MYVSKLYEESLEVPSLVPTTQQALSEEQRNIFAPNKELSFFLLFSSQKRCLSFCPQASHWPFALLSEPCVGTIPVSQPCWEALGRVASSFAFTHHAILLNLKHLHINLSFHTQCFLVVLMITIIRSNFQEGIGEFTLWFSQCFSLLFLAVAAGGAHTQVLTWPCWSKLCLAASLSLAWDSNRC